MYLNYNPEYARLATWFGVDPITKGIAVIGDSCYLLIEGVTEEAFQTIVLAQKRFTRFALLRLPKSGNIWLDNPGALHERTVAVFRRYMQKTFEQQGLAQMFEETGSTTIYRDDSGTLDEDVDDELPYSKEPDEQWILKNQGFFAVACAVLEVDCSTAREKKPAEDASWYLNLGGQSIFMCISYVNYGEISKFTDLCQKTTESGHALQHKPNFNVKLLIQTKEELKNGKSMLEFPLMLEDESEYKVISIPLNLFTGLDNLAGRDVVMCTRTLTRMLKDSCLKDELFSLPAEEENLERVTTQIERKNTVSDYEL